MFCLLLIQTKCIWSPHRCATQLTRFLTFLTVYDMPMSTICMMGDVLKTIFGQSKPGTQVLTDDVISTILAGKQGARTFISRKSVLLSDRGTGQANIIDELTETVVQLNH